MKAATVTEIKRELKEKSPQELIELCLRLSKFKKENKELLTFLLYEAQDIDTYILSVQADIDDEFAEINTPSFYYIKKSIRKILRNTKKFIRYTQSKQVEVELLIHFCKNLSEMEPSMHRSTTLLNLYDRQISIIRKAISTLNEDLQYDYTVQLESL